MKRICKTHEPRELTEYRATKDSHFDNIPARCKVVLRNALLKEQGYICAYCMRRIPVKDSSIDAKSKIEHIRCRENHQDETLDYSNMIICCPGSINGNLHCDSSKGKKNISFDIFSNHFIDTLKYRSKDGEISSSNAVYKSELKKILNLNNALLKSNRIDALKGVIAELNSVGWNKRNIQRFIAMWENKNIDGKYKEYCEMILYVLRNSLKRY